MEEHDAPHGSAQMNKRRDTKRFDHFLLAYFFGIIVISFYALMSSR